MEKYEKAMLEESIKQTSILRSIKFILGLSLFLGLMALVTNL